MRINDINRWISGRFRWATILCLSLALVLMGCGGISPVDPSAIATVQVSRVVSGNTVEILDPAGQSPATETVRLLGITAPDLDQEPWGNEAKAYLSDLLTGQLVQLEPGREDRDRFDRRLGYLWLDGELINEQIVVAGHALVEVRSPNLDYEPTLIHAQASARQLGLGIWDPENPMRQTPAEFRRRQEAVSGSEPDS